MFFQIIISIAIFTHHIGMMDFYSNYIP